MKGLLIKDFKLIKNQKNFFFIMLVMAFGIMFMNSSPIFMVSYMTFITSLFVVSSISYDEYNNGYPFLFTLPITRKGYVKEKYIFGMILGGSSWLLSFPIATAYSYSQGAPVDLAIWITTCFALLCVCYTLLSLTIPVQLKFGQTKGNIALFAVCGVVFVIGFLIYLILEKMGIPVSTLLSFLDNFQSPMMAELFIIAFVLGLCLLVMVISYIVSVKIMEKKEF